MLRHSAGAALLLAAFLVVLHVDTACSDPDPTAGSTAPIEIGSLVALTGDLSGSGKDNTEAAALAVEQINAAGGVLGRSLKLVAEDDKTTVDGARAGYTNLIGRKVAVVIGPSSSAQVVGVADLIASSRTLTIGRTSTSPLLTTIADDDFFFRIAPSDVFQAKVLAKLVKGSNVERLCIVHREDTYGTRLADALASELGSGGPQIVRSPYNPTLKDLSFVLPKCDSIRCSAVDGGAPGNCSDDAKVGLVMITFINDGKAILDSAPSWSASKQKILFTDGARDVELVKLGLPEERLQEARGTIPSGPDPTKPEGDRLAAYQAAFQQRYGAPPPAFSQNAFEAVYIAATAIEIAGTTDGPAVRDAVRRTSTPGGVKVSAGKWQEIREAIANKQPIDYRGVSGEMDFDGNGDVKPPYYYRVWRIDRGESKTDAIEKVEQ